MSSSLPQYTLLYRSIYVLTIFGISSCQETPTEQSSLATGVDSSAVFTQSHEEDDAANTIPFADAEAFFEFNTTDDDLGLQIFLDAEGWDKVNVQDPNQEKIVEVLTRGTLSELGITELRFESAEPSPEEVLALFPPGEYRFRGQTVEGDELRSTAELSHDFLEPPTITPCDGKVVDPNNTVVKWKAPGAELVEIIIESEETDNLFDITVESSVTSLNVPPQFLEPGLEYKLEILALAENGNRTIVETTFVTAE